MSNDGQNSSPPVPGQGTPAISQQMPYMNQQQQRVTPQMMNRPVQIRPTGGASGNPQQLTIQEQMAKLSQNYQLLMRQAQQFGRDTPEGQQALVRAATIRELANQLRSANAANNPQLLQQQQQQQQQPQSQQQQAQRQAQIVGQQPPQRLTPVMGQRMLQQQGSSPMAPQQQPQQQPQQGMPMANNAAVAARQQQLLRSQHAAKQAQFAQMSPAEQQTIRRNQLDQINKYIVGFHNQITNLERQLSSNPQLQGEERAKVEQTVRELTAKREHYVANANDLAQQIQQIRMNATQQQQGQQGINVSGNMGQRPNVLPQQTQMGQIPGQVCLFSHLFWKYYF